MQDLDSKFNSYPNISDWVKSNQPNSELYYKSGVGRQAKCGLAMQDLVGFEMPEPKVAETHTSKSVGLPVQCFKVHHYTNGGAYVFVRDNFHDIKVSVVSKYPIILNYDVVHRFMTQEEYDAEKLRFLNYSGSRMSEEEKQGDNWIKNWSHNTILRKDDKIWKAYCVYDVYCEGINRIGLPNEVFTVYEEDKSMFTIAMGLWTQVASLMDMIYRSVSHGAYLELEKARGVK